MALAVINMVIASEVDKRINRNYIKIMKCAIAPDISKIIEKNKLKSHFLDNVENDVPNMDRFIEKYISYISMTIILI